MQLVILFAYNFIHSSYIVEEVLSRRLLKVKDFYENEVFVFMCVCTLELMQCRECCF